MLIDDVILEKYLEDGVDYFSKELELTTEEIFQYGLEFESMKRYLSAIAIFDYCVKNTSDEHRRWEIQSFKDRAFMEYYEDSFFLRLHYSQEVDFDLQKAR